MKTILLIAVTLLFVGCGEEVYTEKYYKEHPKEQIKKAKECNTLNTMTPSQKEDCQNVFSSLRKRGEILDSTAYEYKY